MPPKTDVLQYVGGEYVGETKGGVPHGQGKYTYENGDCCWGAFQNGVMEGKGEIKYRDGSHYKGDFVDDKPHGTGVFTFKDGTVYEGEFVEEVMQGKCKMMYSDGRIYQGDMHQDKRHGRGKMTLPNGEYYEGEWKMGRKHGKGYYHFPNGDTYDGDYENDIKQGHGVFRWANGDTYEGGIKNGLKHGKGILRFANGEVYAGEFIEGQQDGRQKVWLGVDRGGQSTGTRASLQHLAWIQMDGKISLKCTVGTSQECHKVHKMPIATEDAPIVDEVLKKSHTEVLEPEILLGRIESRSALLAPPELQKRDDEEEEEEEEEEEQPSALVADDDDLSDEEYTDEDFKGWKRGNILGKGSFGAVYLGLLTNGKFVAAKTIEFGSNSATEDLEVFQAELDLMKGLRHKNIVRYLGSQFLPDDNMLNMFVEYVPQGTLSQVTKKFNTLPIPTVRSMTQQILEGLKYLHANGIVHRDIKGENILLNNEGTIKLADFGCSKKLDQLCSKTHGCNTMVGTPYWMAPEVITNEQGYGFKADIWSVGCTIVEMLTAKPPWPEFASMWQAIYHIANSTGPPPNIPTEIVSKHPDLGDFLNKCFERDVNLRPEAVELLKHVFLVQDQPKKKESAVRTTKPKRTGSGGSSGGTGKAPKPSSKRTPSSVPPSTGSGSKPKVGARATPSSQPTRSGYSARPATGGPTTRKVSTSKSKSASK